MRVGVVFPQTEIGADPGAIREFAQTAETLGYDHLVAFDHVLGANVASRPDWQGPYKHTDMFHEPFVLFGYLAGITQRLELVCAVIILPQRQTALVAKQAAEIDVLSGGRLRLGIGTGWNEVEYEALGENFQNRGLRSEEQVELLRALWTQELVTFHGKWHDVTDAGINPLPIQQPIPLWFGGRDDRMLQRLARLGNGWFPLMRPDERARALISQLHEYTRQAGRNPTDIGIESWISIGRRSKEELGELITTWAELGATHISVNTMNVGLETPADHIDAIRRFKEAADSVSDK